MECILVAAMEDVVVAMVVALDIHSKVVSAAAGCLSEEDASAADISSSGCGCRASELKLAS